MNNINSRHIDIYFSTQISFFSLYYTVLLAVFYIFAPSMPQNYYIPCFTIYSISIKTIFYNKIKYLDLLYVIGLFIMGDITGLYYTFYVFSTLYILAVAPFHCCKFYSYCCLKMNIRPPKADNYNIMTFYIDKINALKKEAVLNKNTIKEASHKTLQALKNLSFQALGVMNVYCIIFLI